MKRIVAAAVLALAVFAAAAATWLLQPPPAEEFPLASRVPADAVAYAGFDSFGEVGRLPPSLIGDMYDQMLESKSALAGPVAVYVDRELEWVFLAQLTRTASVFAQGEVIDGVAVIAQSPAALERHKNRSGTLRDREPFRRLKSRVFVDLEALRLPSRLRDFSAAGFELDPGPPLVLHGRGLFRGGVFGLFVEHYLQAPFPPPPAGDEPVAATFIEHFPRLWDEITHDLSPGDRERLRQAVFVLNRDFLDGRGMRDFLRRVGPRCGLALVPTEHPFPALAGWIDIPGEEDRKTVHQILHKATYDIVQYYKDRGEAPPFTTTAEGDLWRVHILGEEAWRLGEAFSPAYAIRDGRLLFTTCASVLETGTSGTGGSDHATISIDVDAGIGVMKSLVPLVVDRTFQGEAEREAETLFRKLYGPGGRAALRRTIPDASTRETFLARQRAQLTAKALADFSKTPRYRGEAERLEKSLDGLADLLREVKKITVKGRFTSDGLRLELRGHSRQKTAPR